MPTVSWVDAAMPGIAAVINEFCVEQAVRTALVSRPQIKSRSIFDRKNYFYPDLPAGLPDFPVQAAVVGEVKARFSSMLKGVQSRLASSAFTLSRCRQVVHDQHPKHELR